jgi:hypothetical protein
LGKGEGEEGEEITTWLGFTLSLCGFFFFGQNHFVDWGWILSESSWIIMNKWVPLFFPLIYSLFFGFFFFFLCGNGDFIPSINKKGNRKHQDPQRN